MAGDCPLGSSWTCQRLREPGASDRILKESQIGTWCSRWLSIFSMRKFKVKSPRCRLEDLRGKTQVFPGGKPKAGIIWTSLSQSNWAWSVEQELHYRKAENKRVSSRRNNKMSLTIIKLKRMKRSSNSTLVPLTGLGIGRDSKGNDSEQEDGWKGT